MGTLSTYRLTELNKRRRLNSMDTRMHQARMALFEEPTFRPMSITAATRPYPYPLEYCVEPCLTLAGSSDGHNNGSSSDRALEAGYQSTEGLYDLARFLNIPAGLRGVDLRAETSSIAHVPQFNNSNQPRAPSITRDVIGDTIEPVMDASTAAESFGSRLEERTQQPRTPLPDTTAHQRSNEQELYDQESLDVDDPRRSYDFADFMDDWRISYSTEANVLPFKAGSRPSVRSIGPLERVTNERIDEENVDMQGLTWNELGPLRDDALRTRRQLHPLRRHEAMRHLPDRNAPRPDRYLEPHQFDFQSFHPLHKAHASHFQLRNVLTATDRSKIFYATRYEVMQTSLSCPDVKAKVMDLADPLRTEAPVRITCLSTPENSIQEEQLSNRVLFAGGFSGEYAMLDLTSEYQSSYIEGYVTYAYNGIVNHISTSPNRRSGLLEATFSSNDRTVRTMDVRTQVFTNTSTYEYAINCSALSPDGRLRLLVGDSNETIISNAENGEALVTLNKHSDHAFACAWSPVGNTVATGAQDGTVILWDVRNWNLPLRTLDAVMSCARSLHFADDGMLVVAESEDVVSIYDSRNAEARQDVCFFGSIAGVSLLDGGEEMVVANADQTVGGIFHFRRASRIGGQLYV